MLRTPVWLFPMQQRPETDPPSAKRITTEKASPQPCLHDAGVGVEDGALRLRRAFRTPPPLMGGGWTRSRGQS